jgi:phenylpyruvate tautomerase PptA (4-oxalocrotonate tautomerase family)
MPFVRVTYATGSLTEEQKAKLAPLLVECVMGQEVDPVTDSARSMTPVFFHKIDYDDDFPGGKRLEHPNRPFWIVESVVADSFFNQARRDAMQHEIARAFVQVLGDDGSVAEREGLIFGPSYLLKLHSVIIEIPEGSWGVGGKSVDTEKIIQIIGGGVQKPERLAELQDNLAKVRAARVS